MDFVRRNKVGVIVALVSIAAVTAIVWFCLAGGKRQCEQGGTLVRVNGAPVCSQEAAATAEAVPVHGQEEAAKRTPEVAA